MGMRNQARQAGFTYLMVLWWVAISGVMLMALSERWSQTMRRQRETELVFRAEQIRAAITSYHRVATPDGATQWPQRLEDLLEDKRGTVARRHLRRLWPDPITGTPTWGLLKEGPGIKGVYSLSKKTPLAPPDGVLHYDEWRFEASAGAATN
jgi:type II secretory pathway pseudopilin PulG